MLIIKIIFLIYQILIPPVDFLLRRKLSEEIKFEQKKNTNGKPGTSNWEK